MSDTGAVNATPPPGPPAPFTSVRTALEWWYRPLINPAPWIALGYLLVGMAWSLVMFVVLVVAASIAFGLLFVLVGIFLVVPTFALVDAMTSVERRRADWVGAPIQSRPLRQPAVGGSRARSWLRSIGSCLTDPERWRQVGFVVLYFLVAPVVFGLALAPWVIVIVLCLGSIANLGSIDLLGVVAGLALAGAAPRITLALTKVTHSFVAWFLGPDQAAELQGRVDELAEQRSAILDAIGAERRRIERNLHDGVQQQLVALGIDIGRAQGRVDDDPAAAKALLDEALVKVRGAIGELRVIGRGLHPAVLEDRGLDAALSSVVASSPIPISVEVELDGQLPDDTAATAYYIVSEAVTNVLKHACARTGSVRVVEVHRDTSTRSIRITVHDDGQGGADPARGTGLAGIRARVEGVDGHLRVESPPGGPTTLVAVIPVVRSPIGLPPPIPVSKPVPTP
ncbi:MAG TPA: sensor histidine kinase [Ilumatobacteraceae bacterium]|nr:sensor histidine kinase [Ilumatobacteraceae bacterium]